MVVQFDAHEKGKTALQHTVVSVFSAEAADAHGCPRFVSSLDYLHGITELNDQHASSVGSNQAHSHTPPSTKNHLRPPWISKFLSADPSANPTQFGREQDWVVSTKPFPNPFAKDNQANLQWQIRHLAQKMYRQSR